MQARSVFKITEPVQELGHERPRSERSSREPPWRAGSSGRGGGLGTDSQEAGLRVVRLRDRGQGKPAITPGRKTRQ